MKRLSFHLIILTFLWACSGTASAWNEDFRPENAPTRRTVCVKPGPELQVRSVPPDEACLPVETRYTFIVGSQPKGSYAFVPLPFYHNLSPPWVVTWPPEDQDSPRLWHFTCFSLNPSEVLGTPVPHRIFRGEITAPAKSQSCESAQVMAQKVCTDELGGQEILEQCWGTLKAFDD